MLWWSSGQWRIRDLGSRNGTMVDGVALSPGKGRSLSEGAVVAFGAPHERWVLHSAAPPSAQAVAQDTEEIALASGELLALPDSEAPLATVYRTPGGGWVLEQEDTEQAVHDKQVVVVGERAWQLYLPEPIGGTIDLDVEVRTLSTITLRLAHSLDEEHVEITVVHGGRSEQLRSRAHHYLLLTLARQRLKDAEDPVTPPSTHGWVYQGQLMRMLGIDKNKLNVDIFRARKQFVDANIEGAASIVERRPSTQQVRIGLSALDIRLL